MTAGTMDTVFDLIEPHGVLTEEVLFGLEQMFGGRMISEFARMKAHELTAEIITRRGALFPQDVASLNVASALLEVVRRLEITEVPVSPEPEAETTPTPTQTSNDADECRKALLLAANNSRSTSGDHIIGRAIKGEVSSTSGDIELDETIVLGEIRTSSGDIDGIAYVAPGVSVSSKSGDVSVTLKTMPWRTLYNKAVEFDLL